jgi:hypothetical protein
MSAKYGQGFEELYFLAIVKKIPVYAMKAYSGSRGVDPTILNLVHQMEVSG